MNARRQDSTERHISAVCAHVRWLWCGHGLEASQSRVAVHKSGGGGDTSFHGMSQTHHPDNITRSDKASRGVFISLAMIGGFPRSLAAQFAESPLVARLSASQSRPQRRLVVSLAASSQQPGPQPPPATAAVAAGRHPWCTLSTAAGGCRCVQASVATPDCIVWSFRLKQLRKSISTGAARRHAAHGAA
jgi:hypothetical protein